MGAAVVLAGSGAAREFFEPLFIGRDRELCAVAMCDVGMRLTKLLCFPGQIDRCEVSVRDIAVAAAGSAGFIAAHNHPSGDARPSESDLMLSTRLCVLADALGSIFLDNLIFAGGKMISFRQLGYL